MIMMQHTAREVLTCRSLVAAVGMRRLSMSMVRVRLRGERFLETHHANVVLIMWRRLGSVRNEIFCWGDEALSNTKLL